MASPFKSYDIRAPYGSELTIPFAYKLGRAFVAYLAGLKRKNKSKDIVIGRDARWHSEPLFAALAQGILDQGYNVIDIGHVSTCMSYHANGKWGVAGSVMITASHNPAEWNGFKLCREDAIPLSGKDGLPKIEKLVRKNKFVNPKSRGVISTREIVPEYTAFIQGKAKLPDGKKLRVAIDYANGMGIVEAQALDGLIDIHEPLYPVLDGRFPNHEANPLEHETLVKLQEKVKAGSYAFGVAFDGDGDRVGFLDETGAIIPMDLITALIAQELLIDNPRAHFLYDLRSSWVVAETIKEHRGTSNKCPVGHSLIKAQMRKENAIFAGEVSGHYYFKANYTTESSALAILCVARAVVRTGKPLSKLIKPLRKYFSTGEVNTRVKNADAVLKAIKEAFPGFDDKLDGVSYEVAKDWWFNVRCSNTEAKIRLNLEATNRKRMKTMHDKLMAIIRKDYA